MKLFAMVSSMRLTIAALIFLMVFHRSEVAAQSPTSATAIGCYGDCEAKWTAFLGNVSLPRKFLARYQNSTQNATDFYCSSRANISGCFSACSETYPMFQYGDSKGILSSLTNEYFKCFTDDAKCRGRDSQFFCDAYYFVRCDDTTTRRDDCIASVQAQRGCDITNPTHQSQRSVLIMPLDDAVYCLNDFDAGTMDPFTGGQVQACAQYIPTVCLSTLIDKNTGYYLPYYLGNVTCRDIENARDCVKASLVQSVTLDGAEYSMPCKDHPHGTTLVAKIDVILSKLLLCSPTTTASHSTITAIESATSASNYSTIDATVTPTTANNYSTIVAVLTTASASISTIAATKAVTSCYSDCEASWTALLLNVSSKQTLLAKYQNSTQKAADYYCSSRANISGCFSACAETYPMFHYDDSQGKLSSLKNQHFPCFTDDAKCRGKDSQFFCDAYYLSTCDGTTTRRDDCIASVQAQRGCDITNPTHQSQRIVLTMPLDDALYCLNDFDAGTMDPFTGDRVQACSQYIPTVCLSNLTDATTQQYLPYYVGNVTCRDIENARKCVRTSLTQNVTLGGTHYARPCEHHPHGDTLFAKIDVILSKLLSCPSTTTASNGTVVALSLAEVTTSKCHSSAPPARARSVDVLLCGISFVTLNMYRLWMAHI